MEINTDLKDKTKTGHCNTPDGFNIPCNDKNCPDYVEGPCPERKLTGVVDMNVIRTHTKDLKTYCEKHDLDDFCWDDIKDAGIIGSHHVLQRMRNRNYINRAGTKHAKNGRIQKCYTFPPK